ncbi:Ppx/GppA phosphatase family protein [Methanosphaerula subterraneus]|uniref:Ppx/GppA phosphatase family protein n=1 Tax=Methanosphaerula subterraneus TaxID=3350244 RepID=UPI003F8359DF
MAAGPEKVVAFVDIGTNSIRLLVVRMSAGGGYTVLSEQKEVVRLGEGEFPSDMLSEAAMDRAVLVCRTFVDLARSFHATEFEAVATSATREARNQQVLLNRLATEASLPVRVIAGREEARLIYLGIRSGVDIGDQSALFIDIGGGSTELSIGTRSGYEALYSLTLGSIRLSSLFPPKDRRGTVTQKEYGRIREHILTEGARVIQELKEYPITRVYGSSGTLQNLADIAARMLHQQEQNASQVLLYQDLSRVTARLCALSLEERRKVPGINPDRADIIVPGAAIIETLMQALGLSAVTITNRGLRDGLLVDYLEQQTPDGHPVRLQSITSLGGACRINQVHAVHIRDLADELFRSSREAGVHTFGPWEEELLGYAAYLHDIGSFVSFTNHQVHTQYLIANADLLGFDQQEILVIASIAGLHRKKAQITGGRLPSGLEPQHLRMVQVLGALLRLAESLDRTHIGLVRSARFIRTGEKKGLTLRIVCRGDCHLEIWGAEREKRTVQKMLGERLQIEVVQEENAARD